jgi:hypothetical protein
VDMNNNNKTCVRFTVGVCRQDEFERQSLEKKKHSNRFTAFQKRSRTHSTKFYKWKGENLRVLQASKLSKTCKL